MSLSNYLVDIEHKLNLQNVHLSYPTKKASLNFSFSVVYLHAKNEYKVFISSRSIWLAANTFARYVVFTE